MKYNIFRLLKKKQIGNNCLFMKHLLTINLGVKLMLCKSPPPRASADIHFQVITFQRFPFAIHPTELQELFVFSLSR